MSLRYSTWYIGKAQLEIQKTALQRELDHVIKSEGMINLDIRERLIEELYAVVNSLGGAEGVAGIMVGQGEDLVV